MFPGRVGNAMNEQFALELHSFYAYLSMSAYCEAESLPGFGAWLRHQAEEERQHAMKFYTFITDRGGRLEFKGIEASPHDYDGPLAVFRAALENERRVTRSINDLYALTIEDHDYASQSFLNWFVTEQVEEEKVVGDIVAELERAGDSVETLFLIDRDLAGRAASG